MKGVRVAVIGRLDTLLTCRRGLVDVRRRGRPAASRNLPFPVAHQGMLGNGDEVSGRYQSLETHTQNTVSTQYICLPR